MWIANGYAQRIVPPDDRLLGLNPSCLRMSSVKFRLARPSSIAPDVLVRGAYDARVQASTGWQYGAFLKSLYTGVTKLIRLACGKNIFVVASKFRKLVLDESIVSMVIGHFAVLRVMSHRVTIPLTNRHPDLPIKYFKNYLANSFSKKSRREILKLHYQYLAEHVVESFYNEIIESAPLLWNATIDENRYTISLSFNTKLHHEGDLSLTFSQNDMWIYELSFTIVPGAVINSAADRVLFVGRVQGAKQKTAIKTATKECHDISPPYLLMAAAQSIAGALAIDVIGGVCNREQLARLEDDASMFFFDYDAFWESFVVRETGATFYEIQVPLLHKPIEQIKICHRRRTRRKRQFRDRIASSVAQSFAKRLLKTDAGTPEARGFLVMEAPGPGFVT